MGCCQSDSNRNNNINVVNIGKELDIETKNNLNNDKDNNKNIDKEEEKKELKNHDGDDDDDIDIINSNFYYTNRLKTLLYCKDIDLAEKEIKILGGRIIQVFGKHAFVVLWPGILPKNFNIKKIISDLKYSFSEDDIDSKENKESKESKESKDNKLGINNLNLTDNDKLLINGFKNYINNEKKGLNRNNNKIIYNKPLLQSGITPPTISEYMRDTIGVGICIINGPTSDLQFTSDEINTVVSQCLEGVTFLSNEAGSFADITFSAQLTQVCIASKQVSNPTMDDDEAIRLAAVESLGFNSVYEYIEDVKISLVTLYSYVVFFYKYTLNYYAYYDTKDYSVNMEYSNGNLGPNKINIVFSHETCHAFGAEDEYQTNEPNSECTSDPSGTLQVNNYNCENSTIYNTKNSCLMKKGDKIFCTWTRGQIGWNYYPWGKPINNSPTTSSAVSMCEYNGKLYMAYKSYDSSNRLLITGTTDPNPINNKWSKNISIMNGSNEMKTSFTPALIVFNNKLYCLFRSNDSSNQGRILITGTNEPLTSGSWESATELNNTPITMSDNSAPAPIVFNNGLYCLFKSHDDSNRLLITGTTNPFGKNWFSPIELNDTPITTSSSPSVCLVNNKLYCAFKSEDSSNRILITSTDNPIDKSWSSPVELNNVPITTSKSPTLFTYNSRMYCIFRSEDSSNRILYTSTTDPLGEKWSQAEQINRVDTTATAVGVSLFGNDLVSVAWKSNGSQIYISNTKQP